MIFFLDMSNYINRFLNVEPSLYYFKPFLVMVYNFLNFLFAKFWILKSMFVDNIGL